MVCKEDCGFDRVNSFKLPPEIVGDKLEEFIANQKRTFPKHEHETEYKWRIEQVRDDA
jgi:hypothetical protein